MVTANFEPDIDDFVAPKRGVSAPNVDFRACSKGSELWTPSASQQRMALFIEERKDGC